MIHSDIALSAAHCEDTVHPFAMRVFLLGTTTETGVFRTVERQVAHPLYHGDQRIDYDFLLLKLHTSALVDDQGRPTGASTIALNREPTIPAVADPLAGVGYGKTSADADDTSPVLKEVEVYYISDDTCLEQYWYSDFVADLMFCSGTSVF